MLFVESCNTSEEDLVVSVVEHDITSHKEGDTTVACIANYRTDHDLLRTASRLPMG